MPVAPLGQFWAEKPEIENIRTRPPIKITFSHFSTCVDLSHYQLANCIRELGRPSLTSYTLAPRIRADAGKPLATWPARGISFGGGS